MFDYALLPPELNSLRMYTGVGATSLVESAVAWENIARELFTAATDWAAIISQLTGTWTGPSANNMATAALTYQSWLTATATLCEQTATQIMVAVASYEQAYSMTVPPPVIATNRTLLAQLLATNFFGVNAAAIAATEAEYMEYWAQDAEAMYQYLLGSLQAMQQIDSFSPAPNGSRPVPKINPDIGTAVTKRVAISPGQGPLLDVADFLAGNGNGPAAQLFNDLFSTNGIGLNANIWNTVASTGLIAPSSSLLPLIALGQTDRTNALAEHNNETQERQAQAQAEAAGRPPQAIEAAVGRGARIGPLAVPSTWGDQITLASKATPLTSSPLSQNGVNGQPGLSGAPGVPLMASSSKSGVAQHPKYGIRPMIMTRPPAGG